jgi:choline-sulfatase
VRAHYAALVKQIDYEVGEILKTLQEHDLLDDTVIIFSADHGDYLGDHNLIGKGHFFESSIHVPMIVRMPQAQAPSVCRDLVALGDVTATILNVAGCTVPEYADSIPLPELSITTRNSRECVIGMLAGGWMIFDGEWRLHKYATGEVLLFNLLQDPQEQHNLANSARYLDVYRRLDKELTQAIMASTSESHSERRVYARDLSQNPSFGREGWKRPYPRSLQDRS